jgi:hypothetical protein
MSTVAPAPSSTLPSSVPDIIDIDSIQNDVTRTTVSDTHQLLRRLSLATSTLPSTIPMASDTDLIASFSVDPVSLIAPGQDPWEDVLHDKLDALMYAGGRSKNSLELSQSIRRGELGMTGVTRWFEKSLFELNIPLGMLEPRIERIIQAMLLLCVLYLLHAWLLTVKQWCVS